MISGGAAVALGLVCDGDLQMHGFQGLSDVSDAAGVEVVAGERDPEEQDVEDEGEWAAGREDAGGEGAGGACRGTCVRT